MMLYHKHAPPSALYYIPEPRKNVVLQDARGDEFFWVMTKKFSPMQESPFIAPYVPFKYARSSGISKNTNHGHRK